MMRSARHAPVGVEIHQRPLAALARCGDLHLERLRCLDRPEAGHEIIFDGSRRANERDRQSRTPFYQRCGPRIAHAAHRHQDPSSGRPHHARPGGRRGHGFYAEEGVARLQHSLSQLLTLSQVEGAFVWEDGYLTEANEVALLAMRDAAPDAPERIELDSDASGAELALPQALARYRTA